tara:strand:+ start:2847 stop:3242 length:396 start_codon:yes stop_codon:yes gene_type:complete
MKTTRVKRFEITLFVGGIDEKVKQIICLRALSNSVQQFQEFYGVIYPIRIQEVTYVSGMTYRESGFSLTVAALDWINARTDHKSLQDFMGKLAEHLLHDLNQTRVCVSDEFNKSMTTFYNEDLEVFNECEV